MYLRTETRETRSQCHTWNTHLRSGVQGPTRLDEQSQMLRVCRATPPLGEGSFVSRCNMCVARQGARAEALRVRFLFKILEVGKSAVVLFECSANGQKTSHPERSHHQVFMVTNVSCQCFALSGW